MVDKEHSISNNIFPTLKNILYLSYDGMTDQLGQSQVIPYLIGLSKSGYRFTIISFEKEARYELEKETISKLLGEHDIAWMPIKYTKKPPVLSTVWDVLKMKRAAFRLHQTKHFELVHCRSYISALVGLMMKKKLGIKFVFDMRGFWADERIDGGIWKLSNPFYSMIYKYFKRKEKEYLSAADYTISLTEAARKTIHGFPYMKREIPIQVIPCCADVELFSRANVSENAIEKFRKQLNLPKGPFTISYLGAIGTWYMLDEMLEFYKRLLISRPDARFLFITNESPESIMDKAHSLSVSTVGISIIAAKRHEVPTLLCLSEVSLFFISPTYSKIASSPTKMAEIMAMGIPIICNKNIGDVEANVAGAGICIDRFDYETYDRTIQQIDTLLTLNPELIRQKSIRIFSLERGTSLYAEVYSRLLGQ